MNSKYIEAVNSFQRVKSSTLRQDTEEFQQLLTDTIQLFINLKQSIYNNSVFSGNESTEDLNTGDIKLLNVEFYMADLYALKTEPAKTNNIKKSIVLYLEFLNNLFNYELLNEQQTNKLDALKKQPFKYDEKILLVDRETKIANFKLEQQLNDKISVLNDETKLNNLDEDEIRDIYFQQFKLNAMKSFDNIRFLSQELDFLMNIPEPKIEAIDDDKVEDSTGFTDKLESLGPLSKEGKILKPFTLVKRNDLQKKVFGYGQYFPTVTVEEFLEQELANGGMVSNSQQDDGEHSSDEDDEEKNDLKTYKARSWDEFVEANPKGHGNTINRG